MTTALRPTPTIMTTRLRGARRDDVAIHALVAGEYRILCDGVLTFRDPSGRLGRTQFGKHRLIVHPDQTITVKGLITNRDATGVWRGYLTRGSWETL